MRFAGLFKDILKAMKPVGPLDAAMRYGPDAFSLLASGTAWAPSNATLGERAGMMLEDGVMGLGLSSLLSGGARHLGRRHLLGKRQPGMSTEDYNNKLIQLQQFGDLANMPVQMLAPRPFSQQVYENAYARQAPEMEAQQATPEQPGMTNEEMAMALLASGALGGSVLGPRDSFSSLRDPFDLRGYGGIG
jgi:hypothetical protein